MTGARPKAKFYAVTNGRENGVYTNWTRASDAVLGFANAKYKGFGTYSEAASAMDCAGMMSFYVYDGQESLSRAEYEHSRMKEVPNNFETKNPVSEKAVENSGDVSEEKPISKSNAHTVYIDGSCLGNGSNNAKAGIGLFWGDNHPWNISNSISQEDGETLTNNKAELRAAIRAVEIAQEHKVDKLVINSDSRYVVLGITQWINQWTKNNWKNASGDKVKNREDWVRLLSLVQDGNMDITWNHVKGHDGVTGNEEADALAVQGATGNSRKSTSITANSRTSAENKTSPDQASTRNADITMKGVSSGKPHSTPTRSIRKDLSNTPIPGCVNGFNTAQKSLKRESSRGNPTNDDDKLMKILTNVETVLENVVMEIHRTRQDNFSFKQEVTGALENLQKRQNSIEDSLSKLSRDFVESKDNTIRQLERTNTTLSEIQRSSCANTGKELKTNMSDLQRGFNTRIDGIKNCVQSTENSVAKLKKDLDIKSKTYEEDMERLQNQNKDIHESISEIRQNVSRTKDTVCDIEKSMSVLSRPDGFMQVNGHSKPDNNDNRNDNSIITVDPENTIEIDSEITFAKVAVMGATLGNKDNSSSGREKTDSADCDRGANMSEETVKKSTNTSLADSNKQNRHNQHVSDENIEKEKRIDRKPFICLIGDSIPGQVSAPYLGKSTNSFVKKLWAPKISDTGKYTSEVKDAKVVLIHSGINNLKDKESTSTAMSTLKEVISSIEVAAPDAKILLSKAAPVAERSLEIERNLLNAEAEKTFSVGTESKISFIDHSNLSDRGSIIKQYYRPDGLHLSREGIYKYTENLKDAINAALHGEQGSTVDPERQPTESMSGSYRKSNRDTRYREDGNGYRYDRDGHTLEHTSRNPRRRGYISPHKRSYEDERPYKSYNYQRAYRGGRRTRDDYESYDRTNYDSHRHYHEDRESRYGNGRIYYYDREHSYKYDYN